MRLLRPTALAAVLPALLSLAGPAAGAACKLQHMEIPVRIVEQRPIAILKLNGVDAPMLVDSGAFFSVLSASTATQLDLPLRSLPGGLRISGYTGDIEARRTRVDKVGLLGTELSNVEFIVGGNELSAGIMGVLGRNILALGDTEYDLAHGAVRLVFPRGDCDDVNLAYWAGEAPVVVAPLASDDSRTDTAIRVNVGINGQQTLSLLDTGAPRTSLTLKAARRAGIEESEMAPAGRVGGAGEGRVKSWTARVDLFQMGGEKIANNRLVVNDVSDADQGMVVGLDYFLSHRIYVSRLQRKVYLTWNGGPVFAQGSGPQGAYDTRYAALPQEVSKDDADALARRGAAAMAAKDFERALEDLNRACELAPGVADYFYMRARLHLEMQAERAALADLDEALRLQPTLAEARYRRAWLRNRLGERPGALADLAQLDASLQPSSNLRAGMAQLHARFDQPTEALRQFDLWTSTHPSDAGLPRILNERCWLRVRLNIDLPLALQDCRQAVGKDDGEAAYHDSLGWVYLRLGEARQAKRAFDAAIKLTALPASLYGRGLAQMWLDEAANGERDLAAARKLKPLVAEDLRKSGLDFVDRMERPQVPGRP